MTTDDGALRALIARLKSATEGSRELDARIWTAVARPGPDDFVGDHMVHDQIVARLLDGGDDPDCPHYTTSLDDALTLVPEGYAWSVDWDGGCEIAPIPKPGEMLAGLIVSGATPVLALCIASLRARLAP